MDVESDENAARGRGVPRADFAQTTSIPQFKDRFRVPNAASGGARPLNDARRTVQEQIMSKVQIY